MSVEDIEQSARRYYSGTQFDPRQWEEQFEEGSFYKEIIVTNLFPEIRRSFRILEVGFGPGKEMDLLLEEFPWLTYVGIDFSPAFIARARIRFNERVSKRQPKLSTSVPPVFIRADAQNLPVANNAFNAAIALSILHHLEYDHAESFLKSLHRSLKPNSLGMISVRNGNGVEHSTRGITYRCYTHGECSELIVATGFRIIKDPIVLTSNSDSYKKATYLVYLLRR